MWDRELDANHRARWVLEYVNQMDLSLLYSVYAGVGSLPYDPRLLLAMVIYEYLNGHTSPAQWRDDRHTEGSTPLKWLGCGINPSRTAWYNFRDRLGSVLQQLNADVVQQAYECKTVSGETAVLDGTFIRACASRHRFANQERVTSRREALNAVLQRDQSGASAENSGPATPRPDWMAPTVRGRRRQLRRYDTASEHLERRLQENAQRPKDTRLPENQVKVSVNDPEATLGRDKEKVFCPLYNVQYVVDCGSRMVLAYGVFSQANDAGTLPTMLDRVKQVVGHYPTTAVADAGYVSILDLKDCEQRQVKLIAPYKENSLTKAKQKQKPPAQLGKDQFQWLPDLNTYTCPAGHQLEVERRNKVSRRGNTTLSETRYRCPPPHCQACPLAAQCCQNPQTGRTVKRLEGEEYLTQHQAFMETETPKNLRRQRGSWIELPFADLKAHRNGRHFHGRGLQRVTTEVGLYILAQNLLTLNRLKKRDATPNKNAT